MWKIVTMGERERDGAEANVLTWATTLKILKRTNLRGSLPLLLLQGENLFRLIYPNEQSLLLGCGDPAPVVMGGDSRLGGCEFKSQHQETRQTVFRIFIL